MQPGQERIYYVIGENLDAARGSPHIELLRSKGVEVLLLGDRIDEWVMGQLGEYSGKRFKDAARGDLELGGLADAGRAPAHRCGAQGEQGAAASASRMRWASACARCAPARGCRIRRPAWCAAKADLSASMRRVLQAQGQAPPALAATLELNVTPSAGALPGPAAQRRRFRRTGEVLYDQARLNDSGQIEQPADFTRRLNGLLVRLAAAQ